MSHAGVDVNDGEFEKGAAVARTTRRSKGRGRQPYAWLGVGALTLGLGAAMAGGTGTAFADTDGGSGAGNSASDSQSSSSSSATKSATGASARSHSARKNSANKQAAATPDAAKDVAKPDVPKDDSAVAPAAATDAADSSSTAAAATEVDSTDIESAAIVKPSALAKSARAKATEVVEDVAAAAATPSAAADPSFSMTSWVPGDQITPGASVQLALQQIAATQDLLEDETFGSGNFLAGIVSLAPQFFLSQAANSLTGWQTSTPAAQQMVANTVGVPVVHEIAQLSLLSSLAMPSAAQSQLDVAALLIPLVGIFGASGAATQASQLLSAAKINGQVYGIVPLEMKANTEPVVYITLDNGVRVPVLVDTGSSGLVISSNAVGTNFGTPIGTGTSGYSGGLQYDYTTYNAVVDFGNGVTTTPTAVNVVDPEDAAAFDDYFYPAGVVGVLGVGANAVGPGPSHPATALPGELSDGILIFQDLGIMVFGPNPLPVRVTVPGSPNSNVQVQVNNGSKVPVYQIIDSGGVYGTFPSYIIGNTQTSGSLPAGTKISVYTNDGQTLLYTYTTAGANRPVVVTDTLMNSGNEPFAQGPVYIDFSPDSGIGATSFDIF